MENQKQNLSVWAVLGIAGELGYMIAIPLIACALGGRFLDKRLGTSPAFLLIGIFSAMAASGIAVYRKIKKIM